MKAGSGIGTEFDSKETAQKVCDLLNGKDEENES